MVLECGGNGRSFFTPQARGNQWTNGGAGCAEWTGIPLAERAPDGRREAVRRLHRQLRHRRAPLGRPQARDALARRAGGQGHERAQPAGVGHERPAAREHPRRPAAPGSPGLAGLRLAQVAVQDHAARQGARRPGHAGHLLPRGDQADDARRQGRRQQLQDPGIDAGAQHHHQPRQRHPARRRHARDASARCRLGRRPRGASRRRVDRLRRHLAAGRPVRAEEPLRLAALDGDDAAPRATATTRSGRARPTPPARRNPMSPATGTRKATAATPCTASPCWWAERDADAAIAACEFPSPWWGGIRGGGESRRRRSAIPPPRGASPTRGEGTRCRARAPVAALAVACIARPPPRPRRRRPKPGANGRRRNRPSSIRPGPIATTRSISAPPATASRSWRSRACRASAGTRPSTSW